MSSIQKTILAFLVGTIYIVTAENSIVDIRRFQKFAGPV